MSKEVEGDNAILEALSHLSAEELAQMLIRPLRKKISDEEKSRYYQLAKFWKQNPGSECPDEFLDLEAIQRCMEFMNKEDSLE